MSDFQFFRKIPSSLYYELRNFLEPRNYYSLLTTTRTLNHILRDTWKVVVKDPSDLDSVLSRINNPRTQLIIRLTEECDDKDKVRHLIDMPSRTIILAEGSTVEVSDWLSLSETHDSVIDYQANTSITTFPDLSINLKELYLFAFTQLEHLYSLSHLEKLDLMDCEQVHSVDCLTNLRSVSLTLCPGITDVSQLGGIYELTLNECSGIVDVSGLTNNTKLKVVLCRSIDKTTINFQNVRYLLTDLIQNNEQTRVLKDCYSIDLWGYQDSILTTNSNFLRVARIHWSVDSQEGIRSGDDDDCGYEDSGEESGRKEPIEAFDLSIFSHLFSVHLGNLPFPIDDFSPLYSVTKLTLENLQCITLDGLGGNRFVCVQYCVGVEDFSALQSVSHVEIIENDYLEDGEGLTDVTHLVIKGCFEFTDTSALSNVKHLCLNNCGTLKELKALENVSTVEIISCPRISSLQGLGNNDKIILDKELYSKLSGKKCPSGIDLNYYHVIMDNPINERVILVRKH
jgi:hypothetical protein